MLKAKIDEYDNIKIQRGKNWHGTLCPRTVNQESELTPCGRWCPLFGEAEDVEISRNVALHTSVRGNVLTICECVKFEIVE